MDNNLNFSQRRNLTSATKAFQIDSIDDDLKNALWNVYLVETRDFIEQMNLEFQLNYHSENFYGGFSFLERICTEIFKTPLEVKKNYDLDQIKKYFFDENRKWFEIYDFIESSTIIIKNIISHSRYEVSNLVSEYNKVLELEFSGYRFINGRITPITNAVETEGITNALNETGKFSTFKGSNVHLARSLELLSDKQNPDYKNSIKESISAVEAICNKILGSDNKTLGDALRLIDKNNKIVIHGALSKGFQNLYGYTADAGGIRHSLQDENNCDFEDANYMLVSCSAFINYLIAKSKKAGINLN